MKKTKINKVGLMDKRKLLFSSNKISSHKKKIKHYLRQRPSKKKIILNQEIILVILINSHETVQFSCLRKNLERKLNDADYSAKKKRDQI